MSTKPDIASFIASSLPSDAEMAALETRRRNERMHPTPTQRLLRNTCTLSLWLERCKEAGLPFVPAIFSPVIEVDDMWEALEGRHAPTLDAARGWLNDNYTEGTMWRWECCAPLDLKCNMASRRPVGERIALIVDDPRLMDIIADLNEATTRICVRPIRNAIYHDGYPVEFRCFVTEDGGVAVSNYYPQMSLPDSFTERARECGNMALRLPPFTGTPFTADFLLSDVGELVFLEGGPPWGIGAHPCCFEGSAPTSGAIALSPIQSA